MTLIRLDRCVGYKSLHFVILLYVSMVTQVLSTEYFAACESEVCECQDEPEGLMVDCASRELIAIPADIPEETVILKLSSNSIENIGVADLRHLVSLQYLYLDRNELRSDRISPGAFSTLGNLKYFDLSDNRIQLDTTHMSSLLRPLTSLIWLDLANNNVYAIDQSMINVFDRLETLTLTKTILTCDCNLLWFKNWLLNTRYAPPIVNGAECYQPSGLRRQQVAYAEFCSGEGTCYQCEDALSNDECTSIQQCSSDQTACQNVIRTSNNVKRITKGCQQIQACLNNNQGNLDSCDPDIPDSACWYCCQGTLCNEPEEAVVADGCRKTFTPNDYAYQYPWPKIPEGITMVSFQLRANTDGHVALSSEARDMDGLIEIVFSGWVNTRSGIRMCKQCPLLAEADTQGLLSSTEDTHLYITIEGGLVSVGIVSNVGIVMSPFMSHQFNQPNIDYIGISTGFGSTGVWTFCGYDTLLFTSQHTTNSMVHEEGDIRLVGNSKYSQRHVEIYHRGKWGYICGTNWNMEAASVACRQLGYAKAVVPYSSVRHNDGSSIPPPSLVWLNDVTCIGNETELSMCHHRGWGKHTCRHSLYASVVCEAQDELDKKDIKGANVKERKKRQATSMCPFGWSSHGNNCYFLSEEKSAYDSAKFRCGVIDATLASINSQAEQDFVKDLVSRNVFWIGLDDTDTEGTFQWVDGSQLNFQAWSNSQPDDNNGREDCVLLLNSGLWNDGPCTNLYKYICKKVLDVSVSCTNSELGWTVENRVHRGNNNVYHTWVTPFQFPCDGVVKKWIYWSGRSVSFRAIVLRSVAIGGTEYDIIGINDIPAGRTGQVVTYEVTEEQQITVQAGDVIGFAWNSVAVKHSVVGDDDTGDDDDGETLKLALSPRPYDHNVNDRIDASDTFSYLTRSFSIKAISDPVESDPTDGAFTCAGKTDSLYSDTQNCNNFYACSNNGQNKVLTSCHPDLVFNPYCTCCDWPENYNCQGVSDFSCLGKDDGLYSNDEDCRSYFSCSGGAIQDRTFCSEGEVYNPNCQCCDWPEQYQCPLSTIAVTYLGCYRDVTEDRALSDSSLSSDSMTHELCFTHCLVNGYPYAGLQYATQCFCGRDGTDYARFGQKGENECATACRGDGTQICGGTWRLNVYYIRPDITTPVTSQVPTQPQVTGSIPVKPLVCYAEESNEGDKGLIRWPETGPEEAVTIACTYQKSIGDTVYATRKCYFNEDEGAYWVPAIVDDCPTDSEILVELADEEVTEDNVVEVSETLAVVTSNPDSLNDQDVNNAVSTMEHIINSVDTLNPRISPDILTNTLETVNHMVAVPTGALEESQLAQNTSSRILKAVDDFALGVQFTSPSITQNTQAVDMAVVSIDGSSLGDTDVLFRTVGVRETNYQSDLYLNFSTTGYNIKDNDGLLQASVLLPNSVLMTVADNLDRCQFVMFQDTTFFEVIDVGGPNSNQNTDDTSCSPSSNDDTLQGNNCNDPEEDEQDNEQDGGDDPDIVTILNSVVISASIGDIDVNNLDEPARITLRNINQDAFNPRCVYWDYTKKGGKGGWSQKGCSVNNEQSTDKLTVCECNHLTNFAMIMDVYKDGAQLSRGHTIALSVISYIGCAVSLIALFLTILTYTICGRDKKRGKKRDRRSGRRDKRTKILLNLVISLIFVNLFFICGSLVADYDGPGNLCIAMAIILHYSLLSAMLWMALEAFDMYMALVKVFESYYSHYLLKMCFVGWGLPIVAVAITAGTNIQNYGLHSGLCWLSPIPFYASFLAPVCLILLFNSVVFIMVTKQLCDMRKRNITKSDNFNLGAQLRASFSITFLLGLTWILAIFAVGYADLTISYLFAIVNSLQGFSLFLFQCVLNEGVRKRWYRFCCPQCAPPEDDGYQSDATNRRITAHQKISTTSTAQLTMSSSGSNTGSNHVSGRVSQFENTGRYNDVNARSRGNNNANGTSYSNDTTYDYPAPPDSEDYSTISESIPPRTTRT